MWEAKEKIPSSTTHSGSPYGQTPDTPECGDTVHYIATSFLARRRGAKLYRLAHFGNAQGKDTVGSVRQRQILVAINGTMSEKSLSCEPSPHTVSNLILLNPFRTACAFFAKYLEFMCFDVRSHERVRLTILHGSSLLFYGAIFTLNRWRT